MKALQFANTAYVRWLGSVSSAVVQQFESWSSLPVLRLIEIRRGEFVFGTNGPAVNEVEAFRLSEGNPVERLRGRRIELVLMPDQAVLRPMVLPLKAREFIDGIVRAQIDRIAPWNADQAIYGWKLTPDHQAEQIALVIAVASRGLINPYVNILQSFGARSVTVLVAAPEETIGQISIFDARFNSVLTPERVRDELNRALKIAAAVAAFTLGTSVLIDEWLAHERADLTQRIGVLQKSARAAPAQNAIHGAAQVLHRKKTSAAVTMIVEAVSQVLPDQTFVTEFQWDAEKLRLIGVTKDAAELVNLLEKSGLFTQATFFAPTMRTDSGERYHIQVIAQPPSLVRS